MKEFKKYKQKNLLAILLSYLPTEPQIAPSERFVIQFETMRNRCTQNISLSIILHLYSVNSSNFH